MKNVRIYPITCPECHASDMDGHDGEGKCKACGHILTDEGISADVENLSKSMLKVQTNREE